MYSVYACLTQNHFVEILTTKQNLKERIKKKNSTCTHVYRKKNQQSFASSDFFVRPVRHVLCRLTHRWIADRQLFESVKKKIKKWNTSENKKYFKRTEYNIGLSIHLRYNDYDPIRWSRTGGKKYAYEGCIRMGHIREFERERWRAWNDFFFF